MLNAARHDEHLSFTQFDVAIAQLDRQVSPEDKEEVVRVLVLVPDKLALHLHHRELVVIQVADDAGAGLLRAA
jgi:hypothetical protein